MTLFFNKFTGEGWAIEIADLKENSFDLLSLYVLDKKKYPFLLESSSRGNRNNRYSIIFYKPNIILEKINHKIEFLKEFDNLWKQKRVEQKNFSFECKNIPFCGGWFIYLGYEIAQEIETTLNIPLSPYNLPTAFAARVKSAIIYDHIENKLILASENFEDSDQAIVEMKNDLNKIIKHSKKERTNGKITILSKGSSEEHQDQVKKCIEYIYQGEIFQANLSRLWQFKTSLSIEESSIYKELRRFNPSPFAGLVSYKDSTIISSSPERLVSVRGNILETRPIAGTRPRGSSGLHDIELSKELINSDKEKAEHLMLLDLERNDISRVCEPGTVKVNEKMIIESYAHVHHIVSNVVGKKLENISPGQIISAVFPGGTITGCPKIRCMEILGDLEKIGRGPYTGSLGYVTHSGDMDINILIRSILKEGDIMYLRAGGGIVADSVPENETLETEAKASAMLKAISSFQNE